MAFKNINLTNGSINKISYMDTVQFFCNECNEEFKNESDLCPKCGSEKKNIRITVQDDIKLYDQVKIKSKGIIEGRKTIQETIDGYESSFNGDIVNKVRVIDNIKDVYFEEIKDLNGNIIHKCEEKLSEHKGHGSAKKKKNDVE